ncbi:nucleotide-binding alpha-beta plait domain-containing protein [Tanacetum coccineum]
MHINLLLNMATKQEGEEDDSERDEKREHVPRRNVVNFFFTNFPPEWSKVNMYELFSEVGEIAYIYVARKSNQGCKRDGWVFDIPLKLNNLLSSSCGHTRFQKPRDGESVMIHSLVELQPIWHINLLLNMATKQEGEEDDSEGDEKREHVPRRNVVNFFFTNFPPEWRHKANMSQTLSSGWER